MKSAFKKKNFDMKRLCFSPLVCQQFAFQELGVFWGKLKNANISVRNYWDSLLTVIMPKDKN